MTRSAALRPSAARASVGVLLVIGAFALAMLAFTAERQQQNMREGAVSAAGKVVGVVKRQKGDAPLVRFTTATGERIDFTATDSDAKHDRVGQNVKVFYNPDNPGLAHIDPSRTRWTAVVFYGVAALVCAAIGVRLTWSARGRSPAEP